MPKSNYNGNAFLKLLYQAVAWANVADNAATAPRTNIYAALHTADPGKAGTQSTSEAAYTGYARVAIARTSGGFTISGNNITLAALTSFPAATAGNESELFFSFGDLASGAGNIFHYGPIGSNLGGFSAKVSGNVITIPALAAGVAVNDRITFFAQPGDVLPGGITQGTVYYVITVSTDDITVSTTQGGASITISSAGEGVAFRVTPIAVVAGVTPQLGTGTTVTED